MNIRNTLSGVRWLPWSGTTGIPLSIPSFAGIVLTALMMGVTACGEPQSSFAGIAYDPPEPAPAVSLTRANGEVFDLKAQRGSVVLLFFGYTHCPDICPTTLSDWKQVKRQLGDDASRVRFVFISVDPQRDPPELAARYAAAFDSSFIGLSGDSATIAEVEKAFQVKSFREDVGSASGYLVTHSSQTFMIDPRNRLRVLHRFGTPPDQYVSDIKKLLRNG